MQNLRFQNDKNFDQKGFTLLECILAVGVLSSMLASLVALQSSVIYVAQNSREKLKANWAMRQGLSQLNYFLDEKGMGALSESVSFAWGEEGRFKIEIKKKDLNEIKPSHFLISAMKFYNLTNSGGNENLNVDLTLGPISKFIDGAPLGSDSSNVTTSSSSSYFMNVFLSVNWSLGAEQKTLTNGFFLIDNNALSKIQLPQNNSDNKNTENGNIE